MGFLNLSRRDWWYWGWAVGAFAGAFWSVLLGVHLFIGKPLAILLIASLVALGLVASVHLLRKGPYRWWVMPWVMLYGMAIGLMLYPALSDPIWIRIGWEVFFRTGSFSY